MWYDMAFEGLIPAKIHTQPLIEMKIIKEKSKGGVMDVPGCIIDNPERTMAIPLVDLNVPSNVGIIIDASKIIAGERKKV